MSAVLNLAEMTADNQMDDEAREDARELIMATAELFDIPTHRFELETHTSDDDNTIVIRIHTDSKPKLTLVSDNTPNSNDNDNSND